MSPLDEKRPDYVSYYNRLLNKPVTAFRFLTYGDIGILLATFGGFIILTNDFLEATGVAVLYIAYVGIMRATRRRGFDTHYFASLVTPQRFRPGSWPLTYPIKLASRTSVSEVILLQRLSDKLKTEMGLVMVEHDLFEQIEPEQISQVSPHPANKHPNHT